MADLCECGCGGKVRKGRRFLQGHHLRKKIVIEEPVPEQRIFLVKDESIANEIVQSTLKVHIYPSFGDEDKGDGGIRRVVEAQIKYLPNWGIEIVKTAEEADVIACHATMPPPYAKLYPRKPIISMCHGLYWSEYEWDNWALKANADVLELIRMADTVTAPTEWVANNIRRHTSRPVTVIPHGVETEGWQQQESLGYVLWNKTRPDPVCDPEPMNQVAALLPDIKFISTFGQPASNVGLTGRLEYEEAKRLIEQAGVYLCTSRETFGIGTLEAMLCGVPVVGFRWGGQAEFIEHGVDGWLATPGDINGLAEGIRWALANRAKVSELSIEKAKSFSWNDIASRYGRLFVDTYHRKTAIAPRTSIIITNYDLHKYLTGCMESVANQSDSDWECIVVDDASKDPTGRELIKDMVKKDSRFKLVANEKNVYLAEARNIGIRNSSGRYILPLDADDLLARDAVKLLADSLDTDRSIHVAYGGVIFIKDDKDMTLADLANGRPPGKSGWPVPFIHENQMRQLNLLPYSSMFRREAWEWTGGYRGRSRTAEDAEMWSRFSSYGFRPKMVTEEDTLVYRIREHSMSHSQGETDWIKWFSWAKDPKLTPAGAVTKEQLPVPSLDPIVISVIIPVGPGHERMVMDAIDSVDAQTFKNWECVVINDTGAPMPNLPVWVKQVQSEGKQGPAHARNLGIRVSKGRLFLPLDADDYLEPTALQIMYDAYVETKDIVYSDFWQTSMDGKEVSTHECDDYDPELLTGKKRTVKNQVREGMIHSVTALTPKAWWAEVGGYDETLPAWEDWDFQLALADKGHCSVRVAAPLFMYRKHTGFRREQNYEFFEKSKEGILRKWGDLWEGGRKLMACGLCNSRRPIAAATGNAWASMPAKAPNPQDGAMLVKYTGNKKGSMAFKGTSGTTYWFGAGDPPKYVLEKDVELFRRFHEFDILPASYRGEEPMLVAEGPPRN